MSERSARDEIRHARVTSRIARAHGGAPPAVEIAPRAQARSLEEIARENAVEGCVRETFGALVVAWQAEQAGDLAVRRAMKAVARDEARHAAFSWALARWADGRLSRAARARVRDARQATVAALRAEIAEKVAPDLVASAGLPPPEVARAMLDELSRSLFT
jgi:hypothetical protein